MTVYAPQLTLTFIEGLGMRFKVKYISEYGDINWWLGLKQGMTKWESEAHIFTEKELLNRTAFKEARRFKPGSRSFGVRLKLVP